MSNKSADLFLFLDKMCDGDHKYISELTDDNVKNLNPFTLSMWVNGVQKERETRVVLTDLCCNPYIFSLYKHPRLLLHLLSVANEGNRSKFKFKKTGVSSKSKILGYICKYYACGLTEAKDTLETLSEEDIEELKEIYEG